MSSLELIQLMQIQLALKYMLEYQKKNNIKGRCVTNVQYLRDTIINNMEAISKAKVKVLPAICISRHPPDEFKICYGHLCIEWNDTIIEPSYVIAILGKEYKTEYYHTINDFMTCPFNTPKWNSTNFKLSKEQINKFISFVKSANNMNNNELIVDEDYYNKQADYVENKMSSILKNRKVMTKKQYLTMLQSRI